MPHKQAKKKGHTTTMLIIQPQGGHTCENLHISSPIVRACERRVLTVRKKCKTMAMKLGKVGQS